MQCILQGMDYLALYFSGLIYRSPLAGKLQNTELLVLQPVESPFPTSLGLWLDSDVALPSGKMSLCAL